MFLIYLTLYLIIGYLIIRLDNKWITKNLIHRVEDIQLQKIELDIAKFNCLISWPFYLLFKLFC